MDTPALYIFLENPDSQRGYLISTDLNLSHIHWTHRVDQAWSSEWPRLWNGLLLAGSCHSELDALRISDGALQWSDKLKGCLRSIGTDGDSEQIYVGRRKVLCMPIRHLWPQELQNESSRGLDRDLIDPRASLGL